MWNETSVSNWMMNCQEGVILTSPDVTYLKTLRPRHNGPHFADDTFKYIFLNENVIISAKISLNFVAKGPIDNIPALVQIMAWRRQGDKPISEPMKVRLPMHICVTRPQWVKAKFEAQYPEWHWLNLMYVTYPTTAINKSSIYNFR